MRMHSHLIATALMVAGVASAGGASAAGAPHHSPLAGTWTLVAADVIHPDGSRASDYGPSPKGLLMVDPQGRYSLQIFRSDRPRFADPAKAKGSAQEYRAAVMGSSTHYGTLAVEPGKHQLVFGIDGASFPNWEGQTQTRSFELKGDVLNYRVPTRPNGDVPISVWKRVEGGAAH